MKNTLLIFWFLICFLNLNSQNSNEPINSSALSIDSNKITLINRDLHIRHSTYKPSQTKYNTMPDGSLQREIIPGSYGPPYKNELVRLNNFKYGFGEEQSFGFLMKNIYPHLYEYEVSKIEFNSAKKYAEYNLILFSAELTGYGILLYNLLNTAYGNSDIGSTDQILIKIGIPCVIIGGSYLFTKNFKKKKMRHLEKAVNLYNDELIKAITGRIIKTESLKPSTEAGRND